MYSVLMIECNGNGGDLGRHHTVRVFLRILDPLTYSAVKKLVKIFLALGSVVSQFEGVVNDFGVRVACAVS